MVRHAELQNPFMQSQDLNLKNSGVNPLPLPPPQRNVNK